MGGKGRPTGAPQGFRIDTKSLVGARGAPGSILGPSWDHFGSISGPFFGQFLNVFLCFSMCFLTACFDLVVSFGICPGSDDRVSVPLLLQENVAHLMPNLLNILKLPWRPKDAGRPDKTHDKTHDKQLGL